MDFSSLFQNPQSGAPSSNSIGLPDWLYGQLFGSPAAQPGAPGGIVKPGGQQPGAPGALPSAPVGGPAPGTVGAPGGPAPPTPPNATAPTPPNQPAAQKNLGLTNNNAMLGLMDPNLKLALMGQGQTGGIGSTLMNGIKSQIPGAASLMSLFG